jgi:hypothetical protein
VSAQAIRKGTFKEYKMKYEFDTTVGEGSEIVTVVVEYETDEEGICDENIIEVWFEGRDVIGLFSEAQFLEMSIESSMRLQKHISDEADHARSVDYDMRCI